MHSLSEAPCVQLGKVARPPAQMRCQKINFTPEGNSFAFLTRQMDGWIESLQIDWWAVLICFCDATSFVSNVDKFALF